MKYFRPDLWEKINSEVEQERQEAELEWQKNDKKYWESFQKTKQYLPKDYLLIYQKNHCFHDCLISGLEVVKKPDDNGGSISIEIKISKGPQNWLIRYRNVTQFHLNFVAEEQLSFYSGININSNAWDEWGYDEFSCVDEDVLSHEILFSSSRTILIHFKRISIENLS